MPPAAPSAPRVPALRVLRRSRGRARARPRSRSRSLIAVTVAVDVNGADLGPAEVARGAARAAAGGVRVVLFGPAAEIGPVAEGVSVVDAPVSIAKDPDPARAVRRTPESSIVQAVAAVAAGEADALVSAAARPAPRSPPRCSPSSARAACTGPALAIIDPGPGQAVPAARRGRQRRGPARAPRPVRAHGRGVHGGRRRRRLAARGAARPTARRRRRAPRSSSPRTRCSTASPGLNFVGNVEGFAIGTGAADVIVADGFTGNVALKVMEGSSAALLGAVRGGGDVLAGARSSAGCCCGPLCAGFATRSRPRGAGRRGAARAAQAGGRAARLVRRARLRSGRSRSPRAGCARTSPGAPTRGCRPRARCGRRPRRRLACPTSHDARRSPRADPGAPGRRAGARPCADHRSPRTSARTCRPTRWTSTRWCRSWRTPYGVKMSDEEAARIHTVAPGRGLRPGPRPVGALSAAQAPRPARAAAGRPRPAGGHALVLDGAAVGVLRAAGVPGRLRARRWRSPRTSTRACRPTPTAPAG